MVVEIALPQITTVIITALIDSINPCAIGVLILLISILMSAKKKHKLLKTGLIYILAVYVTYFIAGLGLIAGLSLIPIAIAQYISIVVAVLVIGGGIIEIKDYFWYGKGFSLMISTNNASRIHKYASNLSVPGIIMLGAFVAMVELPCTGGPYLAITLILSQNFNFAALLLLAFYNVIFVMPLVVILFLVYFGAVKVQTLKKWKQKNRGYMRLITGIVLILLGWLLILIANGTINFG